MAKARLIHNISAHSVLSAVERWASSTCMIREIELLGHAPPAEKGYNQSHRDRMAQAFGRLDALLIPYKPWECPWSKKVGGWIWRQAKLVGVEVKVSRSDFNAGLKKGQYERYGDNLAGLYVATPAGLIKTAELPKGVGHLVVRERHSNRDSGRTFRPHEYVATCRRHPTFTDHQPPPEMFWKIIAGVVASVQEDGRDAAGRLRRGRHAAGEVAKEIISAAMRAAEDRS